MGGIGCGRDFLVPPKKTVEGCPCVSIQELQAHGVFAARGAELVRWSQQPRRGQQPGGVLLPQVAARAGEDYAVIVAVHADPQGELRAAEAVVTLSWTDCQFGGRRAWFLCPLGRERGEPCGRRVSRLYLTGSGVLTCRHCARLGYGSDHVEDRLRPLHKAQKILRGLGGSGRLADGFPPRPKGMHYDIYHSSQWKVKNLLDEAAGRLPASE